MSLTEVDIKCVNVYLKKASKERKKEKRTTTWVSKHAIINSTFEKRKKGPLLGDSFPVLFGIFMSSSAILRDC